MATGTVGAICIYCGRKVADNVRAFYITLARMEHSYRKDELVVQRYGSKKKGLICIECGNQHLPEQLHEEIP